MSSSCGVRMEMKQSSKWRAILLLCVIAAPVVLGQDFCKLLLRPNLNWGLILFTLFSVDYLLSTHDLVEVPELSKTNLGSDNLYIVDHGTEDEPDFDFGMSYQLYKPNKGKASSYWWNLDWFNLLK